MFKKVILKRFDKKIIVLWFIFWKTYIRVVTKISIYIYIYPYIYSKYEISCIVYFFEKKIRLLADN